MEVRRELDSLPPPHLQYSAVFCLFRCFLEWEREGWAFNPLYWIKPLSPLFLAAVEGGERAKLIPRRNCVPSLIPLPSPPFSLLACMKDETSGNAPPPPLSPTLIFPHKQGKQKLLSRRSPPPPPSTRRRRRRRRVRSAFVALPFPFFLRCCHLSMHKKKERKVSPAQEMPDVGGFRKVPREFLSTEEAKYRKNVVHGTVNRLID